jgi:hypothetical protein
MFYDLFSQKSEHPRHWTGVALSAALAGKRILEIGIGIGHFVV